MTEDDPNGFDKEAERRKLEEKYGENSDDDTRRMSELLLKGATMTNRHCGTCGDPLFRQNGEEFCPTCNAAGENGPAESASSDTQATDQRTETDQEALSPEESTDRTTADPAQQSRSTEPRDSADRPRADTNGRAQNRSPEQTTTESSHLAPSDADVPDQRAAPERETPAAGDLDTARETLIAAVTRHARAGAETTDPRRAKDQFAAAREAAEALAALRR